MKTSTLWTLALAVSLGATTRGVANETTFLFTDLGTLGGPASAAFGLNDLGQVVGWSEIEGCLVDGRPCRRAFLWSAGTMIDLGLLPGDEDSTARAINDAGLVVGTSESDVVAASGTFHGVVWDGGAPVPLPDLGDGQSFAHDVNASGTIVGHAQDTSVLRDRAVIWQSGVITNVGDSEPHAYNRAYGISDSGLLAGFAWNLFQPNDAILHAGSWITIGGQAGPFQNAEASDVNDAGMVVGLQAFPSGAWHAAMWTQDVPGGTDLGTLPGMPYAELYDVNESGLAVGRAYEDGPPQTSRAVFYDGVKLVDLNDLLPSGVDAVLWEAREINEAGDIAGTAVIDGVFHAFLMEVDVDGAWSDLGSGLAGTAGTPQLVGSGALCDGNLFEIDLTDARPDALAWFILGLQTIDLPFKGGTLVPAFEAPFGLNVPLVTDGNGSIPIGLNWPAGIPSGTDIFFQYWIVDPAGPFGFAASNALQGTSL